MSETAELAQFIADTSYDDIPQDVVRKAKQCARGHFAATLYSRKQVALGDQLVRYVRTFYGGGDCTIIGGGRSNLFGAALANASNGQLKGCDDTFSSLLLHPTSPILSAALAVAEDENTSGEELLAAYTVGVDTAYHLAHSTYPSHYDYWHGTCTIGTFGATAAVASILDLSTEDVRQALGVAASMSAGMQRNSSPMHELHSGLAAKRGIEAGIIASEGFPADDSILDGEFNYGEAMTPDGTYDPATIVPTGDPWGVLDIGIKVFPCAVILHSPVEALRKLIVREDITRDSVSSIEVELDKSLSVKFVDGPPSRLDLTRRSVKYCLAALLHEGSLGPDEFTQEYFDSGKLDETMERIETTFIENFLPSELPAYASGHGARVHVRTLDGEEYTATEETMPGSISNPLDDDLLEETFMTWATTVMSEEESAELSDAVMRLETFEDVNDLSELLHVD